MSKSLILCCDGTNNEMTGHETNVLRLFRSLMQSDDQLVFYDPGVGTLADPMALSSVRKLLQRSLDAAIGRTVCQNFSDVYRFLAEHHEEGDQVYLFGFSRGAYTARAVAGAMNMLGLLRQELLHLVPYVWAIYANDGGMYDVRRRFGGAARFRKLFCRAPTPRIRCMGLWDTVGSFGWFWNFQTLPYTATNPSVDYVRHAVSIDERRAAFASNLFYDTDGPAASETVKQVWFPGVHSDVGGGYEDDKGQLSKISFEWMVDELRALGGLRFDVEIVDRILGKDGDFSRPDAGGELHNSLAGLWNLLEWLPRRHWHKVDEDTPAATRATNAKRDGVAKTSWKKAWEWPHLYARRSIPSNAWLHPSVFERMDMVPGYNPCLPATGIRLAHVIGHGLLPTAHGADVAPGGTGQSPIG